jgi:hypothetical protein
MGRQRLCKRAAKATRHWAMHIKNLLLTSWFNRNDDDKEFHEALSLAMVPACIYRGGCPEGKKTCGYWTRMQEEYTGMTPMGRAYLYQRGTIEWNES